MNRCLFWLRRSVMFLFVIILPFGVRVDPEHPGEISVSAGGGTGQLVTVLRDCDGNVTASEKSSFSEIGGSVQYSRRMEGGQFLVVGLRSGTIHSSARFPMVAESYPERIYGSYGREVDYNYWNPYVSMEHRSFGFGVGYLGGRIPFTFGEEGDEFPISGHLRFGNYRRTSLMFTVNEDLPLAAGSGFAKLGLSMPLGAKARLFTGASVGFYEDMGLVEQVTVAISERFDLDLGVRLGSTDSKFNGGVAVGLRYHIPTGTADVPWGEPGPEQGADEGDRLDLR